MVFNGPDEQFISGRVMGADGGIGGTYGVMPELFIEMDRLIRAGKVAEALPIQNAVDGIIYTMCAAKGNLYAVIKEILRRREDLDLGGGRKPLFDLVPEDDAIVEKAAGMIDAAMKRFVG